MSNEIHSVSVRVPCGPGTLDGRMLFAAGTGSRPGVLVCPPHPFLAGNLDNNVVRAVGEALARRGLAVLAFNYRAVGGSWHPQPELPLFEYWSRLDAAGDYGEIDGDVAEVARYARRVFGGLRAAVGYSFGARFAARIAPQCWVAIAPPSAHGLGGDHGLVLEAEADGLAPTILPDALSAGVRRERIAGADHFFRGHEEEVGRWVAEFVLAEGE